MAEWGQPLRQFWLGSAAFPSPTCRRLDPLCVVGGLVGADHGDPALKGTLGAKPFLAVFALPRTPTMRDSIAPDPSKAEPPWAETSDTVSQSQPLLPER